MTTDSEPSSEKKVKITILEDRGFRVEGGLPLVRKRQISSEYGEPLAWEKGKTFKTGETYELCRCGHSKEKPFCDGSHYEVEFDGTETADTNTFKDRQFVLPGGKQVTVRRDYSLCASAGFCGTRFTNIEKMLKEADDTQLRSLLMAMVERCPSGSYTYSLAGEETDIEPDLPVQIAVLTEMTDEGPILGPLWVTGNVPIERSDGQPMEARNRVTLCRCGLSRIKPLCDGTHRRKHVTE
jgi:CDGSH-type Zn-finger protein